MKRVLFLVVPLLLVVTAVEPTRATGAETWRFVFSGLAAHAYFAETVGCIETFAAVGGGDGVFKEDGEPPVHLVAESLVVRHDVCADRDLLLAVGHGPASIQIDRNLTAASLTAAVPAIDLVSGADVVIDVDVDWIGTGAIHRGGFREIVSLPSTDGTLALDRAVDTRARDAVATGSISVDGVDHETAFIGGDMEDEHFCAVTVTIDP